MKTADLARRLGFLLLLLAPFATWAQAGGGLPMVTSTAAADGSQTYTLSVQTLLTLTALTFIPAALLMMTSFTRIIIVLSLLRHALGTQTSPPNQVLVGLALFLSFFIMSPVLDRIHSEAYHAAVGGQDQLQCGRRAQRRGRCASSC
jgi:flagellar biosynthetic protein FliP